MIEDSENCNPESRRSRDIISELWLMQLWPMQPKLMQLVTMTKWFLWLEGRLRIDFVRSYGQTLLY